MNSLFSLYSGEPLYIQLFMYYRDMIIGGTLKYGDKLPSVRRCAAEFNISKMTVESAYMQLTAEGYVYSKSQSGYYVSKISDIVMTGKEAEDSEEDRTVKKPEFDLSGADADMECFDFKLWQKYVKNALRCEDRLLSYGEAQGEYDLRKALSDYATKQRGVICKPSDIVIGAGVQSLLHILCALDENRTSVIFSGSPFNQGIAVFEDYNYKIFSGEDEYDNESDVSFIYTSPSHSNKFCDVMNISKRADMLNFAREHNSIILEDDYDSEFCYFSRPVSSLQGLDGGKNVVYIGTFSKLLLPSIRISYMVLPEKLKATYHKREKLYNQTVSKTEQIALARFITDGKLVAQIRKSKKYYERKAELLKESIVNELVPLKISISDSGFMVYFEIKCSKNLEQLAESLTYNGLKVKSIEDVKNGIIRVYISSTSITYDLIPKSVKLLKELSYV